jgi:hypothetical protein
MPFSQLSLYFFLLDSIIVLNTLLSNTHNLRSSLVNLARAFQIPGMRADVSCE